MTVPAEDRCTPSALHRHDQRHGTASPAPRWLLVEQPGPWGRNAVAESSLDAGVAGELLRRTAAAGVRLLLIRRPGRSVRTPVRRWAYVDARPGRERSWWGTFSTDTDLTGVPLDGSCGTPSDEPVYLVCAHGRHDACCAIRGRPVAAALAAAYPHRTWECSHVGGDRFAANLVLLPHGLYYGHVTPTTAQDVVAAYDEGLIDPTWLRGRSAFLPPVQAAQHHARLALEDFGVDALRPVSARQLAAGAASRWLVRMTHAGGAVEVVVEEGVAAPALLTCAMGRPEPARTFRLVALDLAAAGGAPAA